MARSALFLALALAAGCDSPRTIDDGGGAPDVRQIDPPDAGPSGGLEVVLEGLPAGADAWIAVTTRGARSFWVRSAGRVEIGSERAVLAAAPVIAGGASYVPTPTLEEVEPGASITVTYAAAPSEIYASAPDLASCTSGSMTELSRERALATLNFVRALVGIPAVDYDAASDAMVEQAALVHANNLPSNPHEPPADATCYSDLALEGSGDSNLRWVGNTSLEPLLAIPPEDFVIHWGADRGVRQLGHRRWMIDPFLPHIAYAQTVGVTQPSPYPHGYPNIAAGAMRVIYPSDEQATIPSDWTVDAIAYPFGEFPAALMEDWPYASFGIVADASSRWGANQDDVDYAAAAVEMTDASGADVAVTDLQFDNAGFGLANHLTWSFDAAPNETYTVHVTGVRVLGESRDYTYDFTLR